MSQPNLNEDLNIVANSNIEITLLDGDLNIIQALDDEPNDVGGLTSAELKAKFDEGPNKIKTYINETLIPEILTEEATEAARAAAEAQREANETQRIENENARIAAEQARVDETNGVVAQANQAAQSWAVGGTGTREGEDTNNAKYWSEQAAAAAGGGVTSFKGRTGAVIPASGDYTAEMVGAYSKEETDTLLQNKADLGADGKVPESQLPSMGYSKSETISDTTKTLFGLDATAVPDDALALLSRFQSGLGNEYVWAKIDNIVTEGATNSRSGPLNVVEWGEHGTGTVLSGNVALIADTLKDALTGNYTSVKVSDYASSIDTMISALQTMLPGKFFYCSNSFNPPAWVYCPIDVTVAKASGVSYYIQVSGSMTSYDNAKLIKSVVGYVNSPDPNAYPPAVSDGYTYTALGQLGNKTKVELFSYVGTNTYGENNPTILTFDFKPKFLWFVGKHPVSGGEPFSPAIPSGNFYLWIATENTPTTPTSRVGFGNPNNIKGWMSADGKTLTWFNYSTSNASDQLNSSNTRYYYIAIG